MRYLHSTVLGVTVFLLATAVRIALGPDVPSRPHWLFNAMLLGGTMPWQVANCAHAWADHLGRHTRRGKS